MATKMELRSGITQQRLMEVLHYDPETGEWMWAATLSARRVTGQAAGGITDAGYRSIRVNGNLFRAHRLAWLYMTGEWPAEQIDHVNGERSDNRWINLRAATEQQNKANTRVSANCKSGVKGVYWNRQRQKWQAKINPNRTQVHLGFFDDIDKAAEAYASAAKLYFGEFGRAA